SFAPPPSARRDSKKGYSASLHTPFYYRFLLFFVLFDFLSTPTIDMEPKFRSSLFWCFCFIRLKAWYLQT
ncbi:MAG: hypothetical protein IJ457_07005, partial [Clostridia bacterium]|nr:hypothetical protein [Clostridia bacterium]